MTNANRKLPNEIAAIAANIAARVVRRRKQNESAVMGSDFEPDPMNALSTTDPTDWQTNGGECHAIIEHKH